MSRLIDADKIIDSLGNSDMDFAIGAVIDEQPTVFDVDKVIEQLEEVEKIMTSPVTKDCFGEECRASDCTVCLISKAIEIMKGGGVE
jgi:hypothetical protein